MTGSGVALILIPVAGTLCLTARLALVFHAEGHPRQAVGSGRSEEDIMHPMFVKLFLRAGTGEQLAEEEDKRRRATRARRTRSRTAIRVTACDRDRGPRR